MGGRFWVGGGGRGFQGLERMFLPETEVGHNGFITKNKGLRHSAGGEVGGGGS